MKLKFFAILGLAAAFTFQANAAVLLSWDFTSFDGDTFGYSPATSNETYAGAGAPGFSGELFIAEALNGVGDSGTAPAISGSFSANNWFATDLSQAVSNGTYFEFSISGAADLENILIYLNAYDALLSPTNYAVYSDNGSPGTFAALTGSGSSGTIAAGSNLYTVDLSFSTGIEPVAFRIYAFSAGGNDLAVLGFNGGTNSIVINGTEAVPEPSTYALMFVGLGAMAFMHIRQRKRAAVRI